MHPEFGIRFSRDKSLHYTTVCFVGPNNACVIGMLPM